MYDEHALAGVRRKKNQNARENGRTISTYQVRNVLRAVFMVNKLGNSTI